MEKESDLKLIQECGFNSFEDVAKRINEMVDIMRVGKVKAEKNLDRFSNQAKDFLKTGQKDKAKKELAKKKKKEERIKTFDTQFKVILEKLKEVKNSTQMVQVLNASKFCNSSLLAELKESEGDNETIESKEYKDLLANNEEIVKYLEIILKSKKKPEKMVQNIPQNNNDNFSTDIPNIDFNNNQNQFQFSPNTEREIIQKCGFNSLGEALNRIYGFINNMKDGKEKVIQNLEKYTVQAKEYLKTGQKDEAKNELKIKKLKEEKIKDLDSQLTILLSNLPEVKNIASMLQILNAVKNCNIVLLSELNEKEMGQVTKEYQDVISNSKEIDKYIQIINSFNKNTGNQNNIGYNNQGQGNTNNNDYTFPSDG